MPIDVLDFVVILGRAWRKVFAFTALTVLTTIMWWIVAPPRVPMQEAPPLDRAAIAREEAEVADLKRAMNGLHPSQNEYWTAREHLRQSEARLRALQTPPPQRQSPTPPSMAKSVWAAVLAGAFVGALLVWLEAYWRAATSERPLKARVFDLREKGYIR